MSNELQKAALTYIQPNGYRPPLNIFPLVPRRKEPLISAENGGHGYKDATSDKQTVKGWWTQAPRANIGLWTNGIIVLDIDRHNPAEDGFESLRELEKEHGELPETWIALTPTGGEHFYFSCDDPRLTVGAKIRPGVDWRGCGGYVLLPPSIHPNGKPYEWDAGHQPNETPLAPLPEWLHEMLLASKVDDSKTDAELPPTLGEGQRNELLFKTACSLRAKGLTERELFAAIEAVNRERCVPPLSEREVKTICGSAAKYERGEIVPAVKSTGDRYATPAPTAAEIDSCFCSLANIEEQEATWLVEGWIPEGQITLLAADGGIGKTTLWCNIVAAISSGRSCVLDPPGAVRDPAEVEFLTTEDSVSKKLAKKLRLAGACKSNVYTVNFAADKTGALRSLKFGSNALIEHIRKTRRKLYVFDPVQGFIPPELNMGSRNAMRDCLAPLIALGEEIGSSFLIVAHTNKRKGAFGRERIADSADLWDISRSVLMAGFTEERGTRYLSNEKNNYMELQETILFSINSDGQIVTHGTTFKRDREYTQEAAYNVSKPKREDCQKWVLAKLTENDGEMKVKELDAAAKLAGYSTQTLRRAKEDLKTDGDIRIYPTGGNSERVWMIQIVTQEQQFIELPPDTPDPWTETTEK